MTVTDPRLKTAVKAIPAIFSEAPNVVVCGAWRIVWGVFASGARKSAGRWSVRSLKHSAIKADIHKTCCHVYVSQFQRREKTLQRCWGWSSKTKLAFRVMWSVWRGQRRWSTFVLCCFKKSPLIDHWSMLIHTDTHNLFPVGFHLHDKIVWHCCLFYWWKVSAGLVRKSVSIYFPTPLFVHPALFICHTLPLFFSLPLSFPLSPSVSCRINVCSSAHGWLHVLLWRVFFFFFFFSRTVSVCKWVMQLTETHIMWGECVCKNGFSPRLL